MSLLLDAASELLNVMDIHELSFKKVSEHAAISQRTMFRYFRTREAFLDALTSKLYSELDLPSIPERIDALPTYIAQLHEKLDAQPRKVMVLLSADLLPRVLSTTAKQRLALLEALLKTAYPKANPRDIKKTAANLRYVMSASSWRYYRIYFEFDAEMATECAQMLVTQALDYLNSTA